jgi:hypothetical protein
VIQGGQCVAEAIAKDPSTFIVASSNSYLYTQDQPRFLNGGGKRFDTDFISLSTRRFLSTVGQEDPTMYG